MQETNAKTFVQSGPVLVVGATGKTGRRVAAGLEKRGVAVRAGSRSATPAFRWSDEAGWDACLEGVRGVYVNYAPDLAVPGAGDAIRAFCERAAGHGVERLVLLSGRGEAEAQACEKIVLESGTPATVVRASWFNQNFSEGAFVDMVQSGEIALPAGAMREPFVDVNDIADVAVAALTEDGHAGEIYEVTGPRLMSFDEIAETLSSACGREITYQNIPHDAFVAGLKASGAPEDIVWLLDYLFATVLDGRNAHLCDGVERALGRPPKDFSDYARETAATGVWEIAA